MGKALVVLFLVLPAHYIVAKEHEVQRDPREGSDLELTTHSAGVVVYLRTWWLAVILFVTFCVTLAAAARLFENLQSSANTGLFIQLSQWRFLLYFLLGLECLLWYHQSLRRISRQKPQNVNLGDAATSAVRDKPKPPLKWGLIVVVSLILLVGSVTTWLFLFRSNQLPASLPIRSFSYWLIVQKVRDGRNYEDAFQATDQEIFEGGSKFRLNVSSPDQGYLYVIEEGPPELEGAVLTMLYPTPSRENAFVWNQPVQTNWHKFPGTQGTLNLWIIWSSALVSELEAAKIETFENKKGAITNPSSILAVREFISKHAERKPESNTDTPSQMTHVRGSGDVVIKQALLQHR